MKNILKTLLFVLFFTPFTFQVEAQTIPREECYIDDIYFSPHENINENSEITLTIKPRKNSDCQKYATPFNLEITEWDENEATDAYDDVLDQNYRFLTTGEDFILKFQPGSEYCKNKDCNYFISVQTQNKNGSTGSGQHQYTLPAPNPLHSSDFEDVSGEIFDTPDSSKLKKGRLTFTPTNPNNPNNKEFTITEQPKQQTQEEINQHQQEEQAAIDATKCHISGDLKINPSGIQDDSPQNPFIDSSNQKNITLSFETKNCESSKLQIQVFDVNGADEEEEEAEIKGYTQEDGKVQVNYKPGDEDCDSTKNGHGYCNYAWRVTDLTNSKILHSLKDGEVQSNEEDRISYYCAGNGCKNAWGAPTHNLKEKSTNSSANYEPPQKPFDSNSPCAVGAEYDPNCYEFLAPIPGIQNDANGEFDSENFEVRDGRIAIKNIREYELGNYINKLFQIAIGILAVISVVMIIIAGVQYMTVESIYGKSDARSRITNAVLGLILSLSIYLIIGTINPEMLDVNFGSGIESVKIEAGGPATLLGNGSYEGPGGKPMVVEGVTIKKGEVWPPENTNLLKLRDSLPSLITVNKGECLKVGDSGCTSTYFTKQTHDLLLARLKKIQSDCSCEVMITGGSEVWLHKSHRVNKPIVDLRVNKNLNKAVSGKESFIGGCQRDKHSSGYGIKYSLAEDKSCKWNPAPHWHISF